MFLFTDTWIDLLPKGRSIIGIVLILFGSLRFYIAYRRYINKILRISSSVMTTQEKETKTEEAK